MELQHSTSVRRQRLPEDYHLNCKDQRHCVSSQSLCCPVVILPVAVLYTMLDIDGFSLVFIKSALVVQGNKCQTEYISSICIPRRSGFVLMLVVSFVVRGIPFVQSFIQHGA